MFVFQECYAVSGLHRAKTKGPLGVLGSPKAGNRLAKTNTCSALTRRASDTAFSFVCLPSLPLYLSPAADPPIVSVGIDSFEKHQMGACEYISVLVVGSCKRWTYIAK